MDSNPIAGPVRTRFAPSPTGTLHLGGARTALFCWLLARGHKDKNSKFILRIEDTDKKRSDSKFEKVIFDDLEWLGLTWDEGPDKGGDYGPYRQSERIEKYRQKLDELLANGSAYHCFCTQEQIKQGWKPGQLPKYSGTCKKIPLDKRQEKAGAGESYAVRLDLEEVIKRKPLKPEGVVSFVDYVGKDPTTYTQTLEQLEDFVLWKSDGSPAYNFAVVVDDILMEINWVIRGQDHVPNTYKQVLVYKALNQDLPRFSHVSLIMGPDGSPLSKRHGAASVSDLKEQGYSKEAIINWLVLLGWSLDDKTNVFDIDLLLEKFSYEGLHTSPARIDYKKLDWFNGNVIRKMETDEYLKQAEPWLPKGGDESWRKELLLAVRGNLEKFSEIPTVTEYFFEEPALDRGELSNQNAEESLASMIMELEKELGQGDWDLARIEEICRAVPKNFDLKFKHLVHPARYALTGRDKGPGFFDIVFLLGKEKTLERLVRYREALKEN